jgi:hypothetical protein
MAKKKKNGQRGGMTVTVTAAAKKKPKPAKKSAGGMVVTIQKKSGAVAITGAKNGGRVRPNQAAKVSLAKTAQAKLTKKQQAKTTALVALAGRLAEEQGIGGDQTIMVDTAAGTIRAYDSSVGKRMILALTNNKRVDAEAALLAQVRLIRLAGGLSLDV